MLLHTRDALYVREGDGTCNHNQSVCTRERPMPEVLNLFWFMDRSRNRKVSTSSCLILYTTNDLML
jgi:hypothetical protein